MGKYCFGIDVGGTTVKCTWAVHTAPSFSALSTIYAANSCSMMVFMVCSRSSSRTWAQTAVWA